MRLLICLILLIAPLAMAAQDVYTFHSPAEQKRFIDLTSQLRCLVCQNQNIAESNAGLASDLRDQIYQQIQTGNSDQQIVAYLVARYGDYILYKPPFNFYTLGLWLGPFSILLSGLSFLFYYLKKHRQG